ncbi:MAG TPA: glycosyl hydrolase family 18 protein [Vitreimonas sp.]|nr:glycosyl hydrolase family 18 protein [Vitreimonas sp.]
MNIKWLVILAISLGLGLGLVGGWRVLIWLRDEASLAASHPARQYLGIYKPQVIGFYPYWLIGDGSTDYTPYLTNLTYFGLVINPDGSLQQFTKPSESEPGWNKLKGPAVAQALQRSRNQGQETSLLLHLSDEQAIKALLTQPEAHATRLMSEVAPLMKQHGFQDLNLDLESFNDASPAAQVAFTQFVKTLDQEIDQHGLGTLTIEVTPISLVRPHLIDVASISTHVDRIVLMAYDYSYRGSFVSGPVAPLGGVGEVRELDVESSVQTLLATVPPEKVILGMPIYGYEWETIERQPGAAVIPGSGKTATHKRITELLKTCVHCVKNMDAISSSPYLLLPETQEGYTQQIFYDDQESIRHKLDLAYRYRLGGVAIWALGYEGEGLLEPLTTYQNRGWFSE